MSMKQITYPSSIDALGITPDRHTCINDLPFKPYLSGDIDDELRATGFRPGPIEIIVRQKHPAPEPGQVWVDKTTDGTPFVLARVILTSTSSYNFQLVCLHDGQPYSICGLLDTAPIDAFDGDIDDFEFAAASVKEYYSLECQQWAKEPSS